MMDNPYLVIGLLMAISDMHCAQPLQKHINDDKKYIYIYRQIIE